MNIDIEIRASNNADPRLDRLLNNPSTHRAAIAFVRELADILLREGFIGVQISVMDPRNYVRIAGEQI